MADRAPLHLSRLPHSRRPQPRTPAPLVPPAPLRATYRDRTGRRDALALVLGVGLVSAGTASVVAQRTGTLSAAWAAVTLWVIVGTAWLLWTGASVTRLVIDRGQLEVTHRGHRAAYDLASSFTPVRIHGVPGRGTWRLVVGRPGEQHFVIEPGMVDVDHLMEVLAYYRPHLADPRTHR